jgi:ABC-type glucose/galactose transport system permease subunit
MMTIIGISEAGKFIVQGVVIATMVAINQMRGNRR